jgi:hypothetical protein
MKFARSCVSERNVTFGCCVVYMLDMPLDPDAAPIPLTPFLLLAISLKQPEQLFL